MNFIYRIRMHLTRPVRDVDEVNEFLNEDNLVQYLDEDKEYSGLIESIDFEIDEDLRGRVDVVTTAQLDGDAQWELLMWLDAQVSDGIGQALVDQEFGIDGNEPSIVLDDEFMLV